MNVRCFLITLFFSISCCSAQILEKFILEQPDTLDTRFQIDNLKSYNETINQLNKNQDKNISNREKVVEEFAKGFAEFKSNMVYRGDIYTNWPEMEEYVNKVFKKVAPKEIVDDTNYRVVVTRDPSFNAFSHYDKTFYLNIGYFSEIDDEAMLAGTLAHELGHYVHYHVFNNFVRFRRAQKASKSLYNIYGIAGLITAEIALTKSIENEREADNYSMNLIEKSGYSLNSLRNDFVKVHNEMVYHQKHFVPAFEWIPSTHPDALERANTVARRIKALNKEDGKRFLVDEATFYNLRKKARYQTLEILLENGDYHTCITKAFEYHLLEPEDDNAIYFVLEGIRRWELFTPKIAKQKFITCSPRKNPMTNLLGPNMFNYLNMTKSEATRIKAKDLMDNKVLEFKRYNEAFEYFANQSIKLKCTECLLSIALHERKSLVKRSEYLEDYISQKGKFTAFAERLLNNQVTPKERKLGVYYVVYNNDFERLDDNISKYDSLNKLVSMMNLRIGNNLRLNENIGYSFSADEVNYKFSDFCMWMKINNTPNIYIKCNPKTTYSKFLNSYKFSYVYSKVAEIQHEVVNPEIWMYFDKKRISSLRLIAINLQDLDLKNGETLADFNTSKGITYKFKAETTNFSIDSKQPKTFAQFKDQILKGRYNGFNFSGYLKNVLLK